jgi:hypothetical protein
LPFLFISLGEGDSGSHGGLNALPMFAGESLAHVLAQPGNELRQRVMLELDRPLKDIALVIEGRQRLTEFTRYDALDVVAVDKVLRTIRWATTARSSASMLHRSLVGLSTA